MAGFVTAITGFMKQNFCAALDVLGDAVTLGSELVPGPAGFINVANGLGAMVCDLPPDNLQLPPPEFTGGQCVGVNYQVQYTSETFPFSDCSTLGPAQNTQFMLGPLLGTAKITTDNAGSPLCTPGGNLVVMKRGNGLPDVNLAGGIYGATVTNIVVTRADNQPDTCGDPSPILPPPGDRYEFGGDVTYNIDGDTTVTVPVTAVYAPIFVDLDGSLKIPVTFNAGGIEFKGELEVAPNFEFNFKPVKIVQGPGKPDDPQLGPGQPGVPVPEDEEDVDVIVGVLVFSTLQSNENKATGYPSVGGPTFLVPRIGSVQFAIKTGNSIGWTSDIDVKNLECYVPCPAPQGAIAVRVTPEAGITRTFTPVRGKPLTSF